VTCRFSIVCLALVTLGCATGVPIQRVGELAGEWRGRVSSPKGHAPAAMVVTDDGRYRGIMYLDAGDRPFHGVLMLVRPGQVRYQGTDGNGAARVFEQGGAPVLKFFRDDGGIDAVFHR
jgi:hypothetical protein